MTTKTAVSLAILKVNADRLQRDYLENFVPFLAECIRTSTDDVVSLPNLQEAVQRQFGLLIPQNSLDTLLRRVSRKGYIRRANGVYYSVPEELAKLDFRSTQCSVLRMHEDVVRELCRFAEKRFNLKWTEADAEEALEGFLNENQLQALRIASGQSHWDTTRGSRPVRFIVGAFIDNLRSTHSGQFEYLETVVKGSMLANALFLTEPSRVEKRFNNTDLYFDTPFLISALGYKGAARQAPCIELLDLLYETGANLCCFSHTVDEARAILDICADRIRTRQGTESWDDSVEYFLRNGYSASDVVILRNRLKREINSLRIDIKEAPSYENRQYVIDEEELEETLKDKIGYRFSKAMRHDLLSVSAIARLRRGQEYWEVEESRALFVTQNHALYQASRLC